MIMISYMANDAPKGIRTKPVQAVVQLSAAYGLS